MKVELVLDDQMIARASELTGVRDSSTLVNMGLEALIVRESATRLAQLGGSEQHLKRVPRQRR